jgi:hypothetical protein
MDEISLKLWMVWERRKWGVRVQGRVLVRMIVKRVL